MLDLIDIVSITIAITMIFVMVISLFMLVDMLWDGYVRIGRAALLLFIAGLCIYGLNSMTGY